MHVCVCICVRFKRAHAFVISVKVLKLKPESMLRACTDALGDSPSYFPQMTDVSDFFYFF